MATLFVTMVIPWHSQSSRFPLVTWCASLLVVLACYSTAEKEVPHDPLADDSTAAMQKLRERLGSLSHSTSNQKYGVVLITSPSEMSYAKLTIPIWRQYCKKHGMGFFLQEEPLNVEMVDAWTKPRLLMELLPVVKWKYLLVVDGNTLPNQFDRSWDQLIKEHFRQKRYKNDDPHTRMVFCPWDCDDEYDNPYDDGACSGPIMSSCIYWSQKPLTHKMVRYWYSKRKSEDLPSGRDAVPRAFVEMKNAFYDNVFYKDIGKEVGRDTSKFIPTFGWTEQYKWNLYARIHGFIKKHKKLADVANKDAKEYEEL